ncbi:MAG: branched-chain amino acid ABC transporter permease [Pseudolabrys sp.]|jgi:branched-chain amino acid transport system permease protein
MTSPAITSPKPVAPAARAKFDRFQLGMLGVAALMVVAALVYGGYWLTVFQLAMIYGIFCIGLNFFMGYTGQASFGQNAFACIGGYGSAILCVQYNWEPALALVASMVIAGLFALIIGYPTLRLRGHYLAMATFSLGLITYDISIHWTSLTQGYMGYAGIPPLGIGKFTVDSERWKLVWLAVLLMFGFWLSVRMRNSRFGRSLRAISGSESGAAALGIRISRYKLIAFVIAAVYASAAGSLFAHTIGFISPEVFGPQMSIVTFTMLYVGGVGTMIGPIIGAIVASLLPEIFRSVGRFQDIAYAVVLLAMLIYAPKGLSALGTLFRSKKEEA